MSAPELRASIGLSAIFGLRMLGMFAILPVFAIYAEHLPGGDDLTLVGIAIGAYGFTQAILQIPCGWWSDRYGRRPVIYTGLAIFAAGSFIAAFGHHIYVVILGRVLQGAGAISAAVMALVADLTRDEHRTKAMAMIGSTVGATFALSLIAGPALDRVIGVPGIFVMTGVLAIAAMGAAYAIVPKAAPRAAGTPAPADVACFGTVVKDPQLLRLNYGVLALHAALMALFIAVPFSLRDAGLALAQHWLVYLPALLGSFVLMLPPLLRSRQAGQIRKLFIGSVALLLGAHLAMPWLMGSAVSIGLFLLLFFTPFNVLEACLPSLVSRIAPPQAKGTAIGVFSSVQFFGIFLGAAVGGTLYGRWGIAGVVIFNAVLFVIWLMLARGMKVPATLSTRIYTLPEYAREGAESLAARLRMLPGVHEARIVAAEGRAYLKVDSAGFDEENVAKLFAGET
ncbi:MAG TPA: MFS transporter [Burkholderiales bacterium]|nr:MFS transporter [Burkholderiales bacterium]